MIRYDKVGLLTIRDGRVLLCRKKRTTALLILPGGCRKDGESSEACLTRELREELGDVSVSGLTFLGTYVSRAAGEEEKTVQIELYSGELHGHPEAASEIRELVWFGAAGDGTLLAPSLREVIFPDLVKRGLLPLS